MIISKLKPICAVALLAAFAASCSSDKSAQEGDVANQDIAGAIELTFPETHIATANTGSGNVLEFASDNAGDAMYFTKEENSEWYYFKATETGRLGFVLKPEEAGRDFNFLVFKKTGSEFEKEVVNKHIMPLRSNLSKPAEGSFDSTGLGCTASSEFEGAESGSPYSKPLEVDKDSIYYICVNHSQQGGSGYTLRLFYCGDEGQGQVDPQPVAVADTTPPPSEIPPPPTLPSKPAPVAKKKSGGFRNAKAGDLDATEELYTVKPKNTVYSIATERDMSTMDLLARNRLTTNNIFIGQKLIVKKKGAKRVTPMPAPAVAANPEPRPVLPPVPTPPAATPAEKPTPSEEEPIAPAAARSAKPTSSGMPAAPGTIENSNAVPEATQKLWVYINVVNAKNNNPINTIVQVVDGQNTKKIDRVPSNQLTYVPIYANGNRRKIFVIDAFSFRKESFELDLDNLKNDSAANQLALVNDTVVLNFELERYRKNDIFAAYNIFFYDDASVMLPKSRYELESLLEMLKENPKTAIRIHGHTNSNSMGKIISLEPGDHDFFRLTAKNKEGFGTAVMLSKKRAESIKYYLEYHGIKGNRLEIKGWGGRKMIYERDVPLAHKNKRVEIEILED